MARCCDCYAQATERVVQTFEGGTHERLACLPCAKAFTAVFNKTVTPGQGLRIERITIGGES